MLVTLPVTIRDALPPTSRVLPQLVALADDVTGPDALAPHDRLKLDRLAASLHDVTVLTKRIKELDKQIPALLAELGCTLTGLHGVGVVTAMELLVEIGALTGSPPKKTTENISKREARRCHKRHLANIIIRHMWADAAHLSKPAPAALKTVA